MKKTLKIKIITFFLLFISLVLILPLNSVSVFAENVKTISDSEENEFYQNYYTKISDIGTTKYVDNNMIFSLDKNIDISRNMRSNILFDGLKYKIFGNAEKNKDWLVFEDSYNNDDPNRHDTREYKFSLYRVDQNNVNCFLSYEIVFYFFTASKIDASYRINNRRPYSKTLSNHELVYVGFKTIDTLETSYLDFVPTGFFDYNGYGHSDRYYSYYEIVSDYQREGYKTFQILDFDVIGGHGKDKLTDLQFITSTLDSMPFFNLFAKTKNAYTKYFIHFEYNLKKYYEKIIKKNILWWKVEQKEFGFNTRKGYLQSEPYSIYDYCKSKTTEYSYDQLVEKYGEMEAQQINIVVNNLINKEVSISYLEPILDSEGKNIPFAVKTTKKAKLPIILPEMNYSYMATALQKDNFNCNGAVAYTFDFDSLSSMYTARYEENIWLKAKTEDGNSANFFLRLQKSFEEYYYPFVESGIIPVEAYNYIYSDIQNKYPETRGIAKNELYGYWGFAPVPDTYSFNSLWKFLFDTPTTFSGVVNHFDFPVKVTTNQYNKLLSDYDYNFIEVVWNDFVSFLDGGCSATYYFFYADNTQSRIVIAENGSDDFDNEKGLVGNKVIHGVKSVAKSVENTFKSVSSKISNFFKIFNIKKALIIIASILVGLFIIWLTIKVVKSIKD